VAVLDVSGDWADLDPRTPGQARLLDYTTPADL
jgi:hypothetical protein